MSNQPPLNSPQWQPSTPTKTLSDPTFFQKKRPTWWHAVSVSLVAGVTAFVGYVGQHNLDGGKNWEPVVLGALVAAAGAVWHLYTASPAPTE